MVQVKVINICWEILDFSPMEISKLNKSFDRGIYQIYGSHPAYGQNTLLYIGMANNTFAERLKDRFEFLESCCNPYQIRIGRITNSSIEGIPNEISVSEMNELIPIVERILIRAHAPAFNKQQNAGLFNQDLREVNGINYIILNWDDYGLLLPEVSTLRFSYQYYMHTRPVGDESR